LPLANREISRSTVPAAELAGSVSPAQPLKVPSIEPAATVVMMSLIKFRRDNLAGADNSGWSVTCLTWISDFMVTSSLTSCGAELDAVPCRVKVLVPGRTFLDSMVILIEEPAWSNMVKWYQSGVAI